MSIRRLLNRVLDLLLFVYVVGTFGLTLFVWFDRTNISWVEFLRTAYWLGLWSVIPVLGVAVVFRRRRVVALLTIPLTVLILYYLPLFLPKSPTAPPNAQQITVMTYNILRPSTGGEAMVRVIREANTDVVALQELSGTMAAYLSESLADIYPHQALHPQDGGGNYFRGQGVFSRYPIIEDEYWQFDIPIEMSHGHQRVLLDVNGSAVVLFNTHAWPPFDWEGGLIFGYSRWEDQGHRMSIEGIVERVDAETDYPVILVGDLNMSEEFAEYALLTDRLTDSFRAVGRGTGFTYPARGLGPVPPIIRLDYIFHDSAFRSLSAQVWQDAGPSDHLPVIARLALLEE